MQLKIKILGTDGDTIGESVVSTALQRGHVATWFMAKPEGDDAAKRFAETIMNEDYDNYALEHAVVDAFAHWTPNAPIYHAKVLNHLCNIFSGKDIHLIVIGGAGSLYVDKENKKTAFKY